MSVDIFKVELDLGCIKSTKLFIIKPYQNYFFSLLFDSTLKRKAG